jgi:hypothetical protein
VILIVAAGVAPGVGSFSGRLLGALRLSGVVTVTIVPWSDARPVAPSPARAPTLDGPAAPRSRRRRRRSVGLACALVGVVIGTMTLTGSAPISAPRYRHRPDRCSRRWC